MMIRIFCFPGTYVCRLGQLGEELVAASSKLKGHVNLDNS